MIFERLIFCVCCLVVGGFTAVWLGIMLSTAAAAEMPIISFGMTIAAGLVVYAVRSAVTPGARRRPETLILR